MSNLHELMHAENGAKDKSYASRLPLQFESLCTEMLTDGPHHHQGITPENANNTAASKATQSVVMDETTPDMSSMFMTKHQRKQKHLSDYQADCLGDDELDQEGHANFATARSNQKMITREESGKSLFKDGSIQKDPTRQYISESPDEMAMGQSSERISKFAADYVEMSLNQVKDQLMEQK